MVRDMVSVRVRVRASVRVRVVLRRALLRGELKGAIAQNAPLLQKSKKMTSRAQNTLFLSVFANFTRDNSGFRI